MPARWPPGAWARRKPQTLELVPTSDRRTPTAREAARRNYQRLLERVLTRHFIGAKVDGLRSAMDLEHSFGPAYVRGRLLQGHGGRRGDRRGRGRVGGDGGRRSDAGDPVAGSLPAARRRAAALWRAQGDCAGGSLADDGRAHGLAESCRGRFSAFHAGRAQRRADGGGFSRHAAIWSRGWCMRFPRRRPSSAAGTGIDRLLALVPAAARERVEVRASSATEVGLLLHGLEFARVRHGFAANSFARAGRDQLWRGQPMRRR